jgi:peptide/nickel transport system substrate-binding protein
MEHSDFPECGTTRRDVLAMLMAGGLAAATGGAQAQTPSPRKGGRIKVAGATAALSDTLDPAKGSNHTDYIRAFMFYNGLTTLDGSLTPQPSLAESFASKDAKTWVFKLRQGVTFHDGKPFTPADVVFTLMRHKDPSTGSKAKALADQIEEVKATGPREVTIRLAAPNADLPAILATSHFLILRDGITDVNAHMAGVGTGPYKLKEFKPGVRSVAVRNENYWKPGRPYLDEIEYVGIADEAARVNALLTGEIDLTMAINPRSVERIKGSARHAIFETKAGVYTDLIMRRDNGPGANPDFVLAMKHLFNREQMVKSILLGYGEVGNDQPIHSSNRFFAKGLKQRPYDLDKAKWHVQKSNLGSAPIPVVVSPAATNSVEMALVMQHAAQQVGLNLDVRRMPADGYWSQHWMKHPVGFGNINPRPTADALLTQFFKSDAPWNETGWKNDRFDNLLLAARAQTDVVRRTQMYADMQAMIHDDGGIGIPFFMSSIDGHSKKLKGLQAIPLGGLMGYMFAENVWLEA